MTRPAATSTTADVGDRPTGPVAGRPGRRDPARQQRVLFVALGTAVLLAGLFVYVAVRHRHDANPLGDIRVSGLPSDVATPLANLMGLAPVPSRPAPDFTLTDQKGRLLSLSSFTGRAVVLEFMDPHCTDICPIVSQEFVDAYHDLGTDAGRVAFVAVNVNQYHAEVADMAAYSHDHQLDSIPSWHFFTGSTGQLRAVWQAYGVQVEAPNPNADIIHTSVVYFIDPHGRMRYVAVPVDDHTPSGTAYLPNGQLAQWGRGMALVTGGLAR